MHLIVKAHKVKAGWKWGLYVRDKKGDKKVAAGTHAYTQRGSCLRGYRNLEKTIERDGADLIR